MEVDQLKRLILKLQSQVDKVCSIAGDSSKCSLRSRDKQVQDPLPSAQCADAVHAIDAAEQSVSYPNTGRHLSERTAPCGNHVETMTMILDAVLNYMQAPNDVRGAAVIACAKRFREQIHDNGFV